MKVQCTFEKTMTDGAIVQVSYTTEGNSLVACGAKAVQKLATNFVDDFEDFELIAWLRMDQAMLQPTEGV